MRVLFVDHYPATPHLETQLELIEKHQREGNDVQVIMCRGQLATCQYNPHHNRKKCEACILKYDEGYAAAGLSKSKIHDLGKYSSPDLPQKKWKFESIKELLEFEVDGLQVGRAAVSNLLAYLGKDPDLDTRKYSSEVSKEVNTILSYQLACDRYLADLKPESVILFNGRFSYQRVLIHQCERKGIPFWTHERGGAISRYSLWEETTSHDIEYAKGLIEDEWVTSEESLDQKNEVASNWFAAKRAGNDSAWTSFTKGQDYATSEIRELESSEKPVLTVFGSNMVEYVSFESWENKSFPDEPDFMESFLSRPVSKQFQVVWRMHPSLKGFPTSQVRRSSDLSRRVPELLYLPPESKVSSYELLDLSSFVVSFGSTMGIEAVFWGKPGALLGKAVWEDLGGMHRPGSLSEFENLLMGDLSFKGSKQGAMKYAYWEASKGTEFKHYQAKSVFDGTYRGLHLNRHLIEVETQEDEPLREAGGMRWLCRGIRNLWLRRRG